jgi:hypothetical protein
LKSHEEEEEENEPISKITSDSLDFITMSNLSQNIGIIIDNYKKNKTTDGLGKEVSIKNEKYKLTNFDEKDCIGTIKLITGVYEICIKRAIKKYDIRYAALNKREKIEANLFEAKTECNKKAIKSLYKIEYKHKPQIG